MAVEFMNYGYYTNYYADTEDGKIAGSIGRDDNNVVTLENGLTIDHVEQILSKMKELQGKHNASV